MPRFSRLEILLFLVTFFAFAYFNQGGGWNQNSRFAEVRAMAEEGRFAIDDFFVYRHDAATDEMVRVPVRDTVFEFGGKEFRLAWVDGSYNLFPVNPDAGGDDVEDSPMIEVACSGDVSYVPKTGHFHPNKPPGTSFLALPAYWLIFHVERALGINPDHWWPMTMNVWLTTIFSVGLLSAGACVLFFRIARDMADGAESPAVLATLALAFGTTFFPFGTILFDHALTASVLIAALYFLHRTGRREEGYLLPGEKLEPPHVGCYLAAGAFAGLAVLTNYVAAGAVGALGFHALLARRPVLKPRAWNWRGALLFAAGGLPLAALLGWYHTVNFGSPLALANDFQNPLFKDPAGSLGMFAKPSPYVGALLLVSPYRGIFWLCPVLILGVVGLVVWLVERRRAEACLCAAIFGFFFLVNMSFNGYHAGFSAGPRYLVPAMPFLALPLVVAFARWRKIAVVLLAVSVVQQFLLTVTDGQNPLAVGGHARLPDSHRKDDFWCNIVTEYAAPLFFTGRAGGLLTQLREAALDRERDRLEAASTDKAGITRRIEAARASWQASIERGEQAPFLLAAIRGPVSVNPVAVFDGLLGYGNYDIHSPQAQWASSNLGEFLWPQSRWSLLPLVLISGGLSVLAMRGAKVE